MDLHLHITGLLHEDDEIRVAFQPFIKNYNLLTILMMYGIYILGTVYS